MEQNGFYIMMLEAQNWYPDNIVTAGQTPAVKIRD
jgi:hypothetical protein